MGWSLAPCRDLVVRRARRLDSAALARVQVDAWRQSYGAVLPRSYLEQLSYEAHERHWSRQLTGRGWAFVAVCSGQIVGIASGGRCRSLDGFAGELYVLYLLREFQRRGIGRALFDAVHLELATRGFDDLLAWVLADNGPARAFYERLGGRAVGEGSCMIAGRRLREVAYGWWD
jgi:GNAT superfamily N-acetyltransferase